MTLATDNSPLNIKSTLPSPQFIFYPGSLQIDTNFPQELKGVLTERLPLLNKRHRSGNKDLILV
ncbi:MAG: hypothetical protein Fur009_7980 [Candidatus Microgenomates bacterium]